MNGTLKDFESGNFVKKFEFKIQSIAGSIIHHSAIKLAPYPL